MKQPEFGKKLVEIRKKKGLTQSELAEKCNITRRTIQRIETGKVTPRFFTVKTISEVLEFDFLEASVLTGDDVKGNRLSKLEFLEKLLWNIKDLFNLKGGLISVS